MVKRNILLLFLIVFSFPIFAQQKDIEKKNVELLDVRNEISSLEKELRATSNKEKQNLVTIEKFNRQNFLINKLITSLKNEVEKKDKEINTRQKEIIKLEKESVRLKDNYAKYIVSVYKGINKNEWSYLISAESIQQAILRYAYLKRFTNQRKKDLVKLEENRLLLITEKKLLEKEKIEKAALRASKETEEKNLISKIDERRKILTQLKNNHSVLKRDIETKKRAEKVIQQLITKLVEKERQKEEARRREELRQKSLAVNEGSKTKSTETVPHEIKGENFPAPEDAAGFSSFSALKGRLGWPVKRGSIVRKFGEDKNFKLNTVTLNYGIDIKVTGDLGVASVAEGVVSAIDWIPGYGSVLIITHKGGYRTVYGHLDRISTKEGDKVQRGQLIGQVGESLEGYIVHFEIWNQRNYQNPEVWLARK